MEGPHGELVSNPRGNKRRVREKVVGTVVEAAGEHKWTVLFDYNGLAKSVTSKSLKVVEEGVGLRLDSSSDMVSFVLICYNTDHNHSNTTSIFLYCFITRL